MPEPVQTEGGMGIRRVLELLFQNRISSFFGMDVLVSSLALWISISSERSRLGMKRCMC
ncbi:DUF2834 domain-containing protein [Synechococcus sp. Nb3U1]|uniref:DUF2834 domain-containing protein n=1 Tax=Synechococcus sp. Nb3U1 TaxID=1914529 RepID=UPI003FCC688B